MTLSKVAFNYEYSRFKLSQGAEFKIIYGRVMPTILNGDITFAKRPLLLDI
ncbi:hypothetical protein [Colwellia psychrerythraea]|uniref:hypothetical protein n=1 Tax=Colwellia psychrerythraea TaxID=28229 RepID=UPI000AEF4CF7|nr:hypothetical protein [Colwellia psychrerythraea]